MNVETIESDEQFFALRSVWNELLKNSTSDTVFLTHEWLFSWWKHLSDGRRLSIIVAREEGRIVGILPLAERPAQYARMMPRTLEFLGSGLIGSDYLDAIIAAGREREVCAAFADYFHERGLIVQLSQLRSGACTVSALAHALAEKGWMLAETKLNVCPYIDLRGVTWEDYLQRLGPNIRKNLNRYLRILPKTFEMRVECVQAPGEAQPALEILMDLHMKRWGATGRSEAFQTADVIEFHRSFVRLAAEEGWLRLLVLWLDGRPAASLYGLRYGQTFYFYQSGFDPEYRKHSVGAAMMGLSIQTAITGGAIEYDFLHGAEEYKFHWASDLRDLGRIELYPPNTGGRIYREAIHLNRVARRMARRVLSKA